MSVLLSSARNSSPPRKLQMSVSRKTFRCGGWGGRPAGPAGRPQACRLGPGPLTQPTTPSAVQPLRQGTRSHCDLPLPTQRHVRGRCTPHGDPHKQDSEVGRRLVWHAAWRPPGAAVAQRPLGHWLLRTVKDTLAPLGAELPVFRCGSQKPAGQRAVKVTLERAAGRAAPPSPQSRGPGGQGQRPALLRPPLPGSGQAAPAGSGVAVGPCGPSTSAPHPSSSAGARRPGWLRGLQLSEPGGCRRGSSPGFRWRI